MISSGVNTRELILEILLQIEEEGEHSHIAIRNALSKYQFLPKQERSFITRVCEEPWNTGSILIMSSILFPRFL